MPGGESAKKKEVEELEKLVRENETALGKIRRMVEDLKGELRKERGLRQDLNGKSGNRSGSDTESAERNTGLQS
jgi:hypothetical protein